MKRLEGTYRADRAAGNEPKPPSEAPSKPPKLGKVASETWDLLAPKLHGMGCLTAIDGQVLEGYVRAYARAVQADGILEAEGLFVDGMFGPVAHPAIKVSREAWGLANVLGGKLGLSPADRVKVNAAPTTEGEDRAERDLFGRPGLRAVKGGRSDG